MQFIIHRGGVFLKELKNKDWGNYERMPYVDTPGFNMQTEKNIPHTGTTSMFSRKKTLLSGVSLCC